MSPAPGAVEALEKRIGRFYVSACMVVFLIASCSFLALQYARAVAEAQSACESIAQIALDEMASTGAGAVLSFMEGRAMVDGAVRIVRDDGVVLASAGQRTPWDVTVELESTSATGVPFSVEAAYRRPDLIAPSDGALFVAAALAAALFAWLTRAPLVHRSTRPVVEALAHQRDFVAAASHELKSPLSVIALDLEAIAASPDRTDRITRLAREGMGECQRTAALVEDLLVLASGDATGWTLSREPLDATSVFVDAFEQIEGKAAARGVPVVLELPRDGRELPLDGDRARLAQALRAVLENALDFAPQGTSVGFNLAARSGRAVFAVADSGPGVPDGHKERIFERFCQVDPARTSRSHHGLGLSIAREIAEAHGGTLRVVDNPGGGSVFEMSIPLAW